MHRIAFLTIRDLDGFVVDDQLALEPLARLGCEVESIPWDEPVDWSGYAAAVIRTTWDYHRRLEEFLGVLAAIDASPCRLFNPLEVVRWNMNKRYLDDLGSRGVPVVPTEFHAPGVPVDLTGAFARFQCHDLVYKPTVGAGAFDTFRVQNIGGGSGRGGDPDVRSGSHASLESTGAETTGAAASGSTGAESTGGGAAASGSTRAGAAGLAALRFGGPVPSLEASEEAAARIETGLNGREYMIQPFVREVLDGETSLFFFDGRYSHAVLKKPRDGDFRVQEEYGGRITAADPPLDLVETCGAIVQLFDEPLLYARVDVVRTGEMFVLMELEVIEPSLYFRTVPGSAERFATALVARLAGDH